MLAGFRDFIPPIPNRAKWFSDESCGELALIRAHICRAPNPAAQDIGHLALSRIVLGASHQESETRYTAKPRPTIRGATITAFLRALEAIRESLAETSAEVRYGSVDVVEADTRNLDPDQFPDESVDLIVTSPPYGNANDYHLYHRFRLFWLGANPQNLSRQEVGSHLRHQREDTGHEAYREELSHCVRQMARVLRPGRFLAAVMGDSVYKGVVYSGDAVMRDVATAAGLNHICSIERPIHRTKRSFVAAGRRAASEAIVIFQRPSENRTMRLWPPPYKLWPYEVALRERELQSLAGLTGSGRSKVVNPIQLICLRRAVFTHRIEAPAGRAEATWQAVLENGTARAATARKDPKYVTHGLHPYKGKFYPQLAKALLNLANPMPGAVVLDPFCGSGTTLLESYLNGMAAKGCDMNPLAAKIARTKVQILELDPGLVTDATATLLAKLADAPARPPADRAAFRADTHDELNRWFPKPVVAKLGWLLTALRAVSAGVLLDYYEVILSSIIREVSHQDPADLRIRRRKEPLADADVYGKYADALTFQHDRLKRFWAVRGMCPQRFFAANAVDGDARRWSTLGRCGVTEDSVDVVLTSPPYATALPYIDTDRLSLLVFFGLTASGRRPFEQQLTGSREIRTSDRDDLEQGLTECRYGELPHGVTQFVAELYESIQGAQVGFRRRNMPALLTRYFLDIYGVLTNVFVAMKRRAQPSSSWVTTSRRSRNRKP